MRTTEQQ